MRNVLPRRIILTLAALILAPSFTSTALAQDRAAEKSPQPRQGANSKKTVPESSPLLPASAFHAPLKTIDGKDFKLSELHGKVLVIDLWATSCIPCRYESPELVKIQEEYGERGFEVIGLDIDPGSDRPEDVQNFIKEFKISYKVAFANADLARSLMKGGNVPQSMVVDRNGVVVRYFIGFSPDRTPSLLRAAIELALQR